MSPDWAQDDNNGVSVTVYCWVTKLPRIELPIFLNERWKSVGILNVYSTSIKAYSVRFLKLMHYIAVYGCCAFMYGVIDILQQQLFLEFRVHADSAFTSVLLHQ